MPLGMQDGATAQQMADWYAATSQRHLREPQWAMPAPENMASLAAEEQQEARIARTGHTSPRATPASPTRAYSARE